MVLFIFFLQLSKLYPTFHCTRKVSGRVGIYYYYELPSALPVSLGWGKKETQFHGSEGKEAALAKPVWIRVHLLAYELFFVLFGFVGFLESL